MAREKRTIYYDDPLNDDFAGTNINTQNIGQEFPFLPASRLWRIVSWFLYYIIAIPIVFFYSLFIGGYRVRNQKALRKLRKTGYFMYLNHTHFTDAFLPALASFPKRSFVITGPDAVSIKKIRGLVQMLGAIPIPSSRPAMNAFLRAVQQRVEAGYCVGIFPEAHIWPYCSFIRPYKATSFRYPAMWEKPVVAVCVTYQKRKGLFAWVKHPRRTIYISEPFYPEPGMSVKDAQKYLHEKAYAFMKETSERYSDYIYVDYVQRTYEDAEPEKAGN